LDAEDALRAMDAAQPSGVDESIQRFLDKSGD